MNKRTRPAAYHINYHFVWCPKFRRPVLEGAVGEHLSHLLPVLVEQLGGQVLDLTVQPDHIHLFVSFPPKFAPAQIAYRLKDASSHTLREAFPFLKSRLPSLWTRSYYVGTAGTVSPETIRRYIEAQKGQ